MNKNLRNKYKFREKIIKAIAHSTRLLIIESLSSSEKCVCELVKLIGDDTSTVSKHLLVLKNAGIIEDDKRGLKVYYTLKAPCILKYIDCIENVIKNNKKFKN